MRMTRPTLHRNSFANALRKLRKAKGLSQEAFSLASSRTHISALERGIKKPALDTVEELAEVLSVHPLTLLTLAYANETLDESAESLMVRVQKELADM